MLTLKERIKKMYKEAEVGTEIKAEKVEPVTKEQRQLKLTDDKVENDKVTYEYKNLEDILLEEAKNLDLKISLKIGSEYKQYPLIEIARFIIDFECCSLVWEREKGITLKAKGTEEYKRFRKEYLMPNIEVIKQLFRLSNKRYLKQVEELERSYWSKFS